MVRSSARSGCTYATRETEVPCRIPTATRHGVGRHHCSVDFSTDQCHGLAYNDSEGFAHRE